MSSAKAVMNKDRQTGHSALDYGRAAQPLPDLHIFSRLSELDEAYSEDLARRRARQETVEREIAELAKRLAAPLDSALQPKNADHAAKGKG